MKKNNNIKQLKAMVNADYLETVECVKYGVQAYNISANEYEVITKFVKENGRYYFVDRNGNRYLASRYDRAELVARDILDNLKYAEETAYEYVCNLEQKKQISVESAYVPKFFDFCDLFGFNVESVEFRFHDNGEVFTVYRLKSEQTAQDDAQSEESAADEQDGEETENNEQGNENDEDAAACEPSRLAGILSKVKSSARKVCEKVALIMALAFVMVVTFAALFCMIYFIPDLLDLFGIECGSWAAVALSLLLFCTVIMDACVFVELNTMAAIDYLFPSLFGSAQKPGFIKPFSFWHRVFSSDML